MLQEIRYNGATYHKTENYQEWYFERCWLSPEQENKLQQVIDFLAAHGYTYSDHVSRWGTLHGVAATVTGPDGKAHDFGFRERWIEVIWRGSILYRLAMIEGKYESPDRRWQPGAPGYPSYDNPYYLEWQREEARRLDQQDQAHKQEKEKQSC